MKKYPLPFYILSFFFVILYFGFQTTPVIAQNKENTQTTIIITPQTASGNPTSSFEMGAYTPLAPLPGFTKVIDGNIAEGGAGSFTLASYVKTLVRIAIGIIGILAVVMIVISGVQYMGSGMITEKEAAKSRLTGAIMGLLLAVSSVLILRTINPQLTNLSIGNKTFQEGVDAVANTINIPTALELEGDSGVTSNFVPTGSSKIPPGAFCPSPTKGNKEDIGKIAQSFVGKNTYRYGGERGGPPYPLETYSCDGKACKTFCPEGTTCHDCSSFVNQVLTCAGFKPFENTTGAMVKSPKSEKITTMTSTTANNKTLNPGDLLFYNGHVVIYIGNGKTAESFGGPRGRKKGNSIAIQDADAYFKKGKNLYVYRLP